MAQFFEGQCPSQVTRIVMHGRVVVDGRQVPNVVLKIWYANHWCNSSSFDKLQSVSNSAAFDRNRCQWPLQLP